MSNSDKVVLQSELDASGTVAGGERIKGVLRDVARTAEQQGGAASGAVAGIGSSGEKAATKVDQATRKITAAIERATAAAQAGGRGTAAYYQALASGKGLDALALQPYIDRLQAAERAQASASQGLQRMGVSAAQTAAALRGVPAQFTDIATSLASGQAPLTVFLQQGGQLKDMFGGAVPAARALGGYIAGLVNPFTLAAAGAVGLTAAYVVGAAEHAAYARSLILTGNAAGTTAAQLGDMAARIAALGGGTQHQAAGVLAEMAAAGGIGAANLERMAAAALALQRAGGPAAEETAQAFAELGRAPLQAAAKLEQTTHFLTTATAAQIRTLAEQGRSADAARVAQDAYAAAVEQRAPAIVASLGWVERAWMGIKSASAGAIDALASVGRPGDAVAAEIASLQARIAANTAERASAGAYGAEAIDRGNAKLRERLTLLLQGAGWEAQSAAAEAERARQVQASIQWQEQANGYLSRAAKLEKDIARVRAEGAAAGAPQAEIDQRIALLQQRADPGVIAQRIRDAEAQRLAIIQRGQIEVDSLRTRGYLNEQAHIRDTIALDLAANAIRRQSIEAELALARRKQDAEREVAALQGQLNANSDERITIEARGRLALADAMHRQATAAAAVVEAQRQESAAEQADFLVRQSQAREAVALSITDYVQSLAEADERLAIERRLLGESNEVRAVRLRQFEIELQLRRRLREIDATYYEGGDAEREIERQRARSAAQREMTQAAANLTLDTWRQTTQQIGNDLTDAIVSSFEAGRDPAKALAAAIRREFDQLVLRPVIAAIVKPASSYVADAIAAVMGSGGSGGAGTQSAFWQQLASTAAGSKVAGWFGVGSSGGAAAGGTAGAGAAAGGSSSGSGLAAAGIANWYLAALAGAWKANQDYSQGYNSTGSAQVGRETGNFGGLWAGPGMSSLGKYESQFAGVLRGLGMSDRWASLLSGSTAVAKIFGRAAPRVEGTGVMGTLGAGAFSGSLYADVVEKGGLFRSDNRYTNTQGLPTDLGRYMDAASRAVLDKAKEYAKALSLPAQDLAGITTDIKVQLGADAAANQKAIADAVATYADALAASLGDALTPVRAYGETLSETLGRLGSALAGVNDVLQALGQQAMAASITGAQSADELAALFGGTAAFGQAAGAYAQQYYSDAERLQIATAQVNRELSDLGLRRLPRTRDEFRALVSAQDLTTSSGREMYASLLGIADAFAAIAPDAQAVAAEQDALIRQFLQAAGDTAALRERELAALQPSNVALQRHIYALQDAQALAEQVRRAADALRTAGQGIADFVAELAGSAISATTSLAAARRAYADNLLLARLGDTTASAAIVSNARTLVERLRATATDPVTLARETSRIAAQLQGLPAAVSWQSQMLDKLDAIAPALGVALGEARATLTLTVDSALPPDLRQLMLTATQDVQRIIHLVAESGAVPAALQPLLIESATTATRAIALQAEFSQALTPEQMAALAVADSTVRKVIEAVVQTGTLSADQAAVLAAQSATVAKTITALVNTAGLTDGDRTILSAISTNTLSQWTLSAPDLIDALTDLTVGIKTIPERPVGPTPITTMSYAAGGTHPGGLRLVGERGPELEVVGPARYWSAAQTSAMLASAASGSALAAAVDGLRTELQGLRDEARATAVATAHLAKRADRWEIEGLMVRTDSTDPLAVVTT